MALENILKKIKDEALKEIEEIRAKTKGEISEIINEAEKEKSLIKKQFDDEREKKRKQYLEIKRSEIDASGRNGILEKKQRILDEFFKQILQKITKSGQEDRLKLLTLLINKLPASESGEILCLEKDRGLISEVLKQNNSAHRLSAEHLNGAGDFIFKTKNIEIDFTLEKLVKHLQEKTIVKISKLLF